MNPRRWMWTYRCEGFGPVSVRQGNAVSRAALYTLGIVMRWARYFDANRNVLEDSAWPLEADEFVGRIISEHISKIEFPKLYSLIARAFGEREDSYGSGGTGK